MADDRNKRGPDQTEADLAHHLASPRAWLVCVGSAETEFAYAGRVFDLGARAEVRFGRSLTPGRLETETSDDVLYIGIPTPWASGAHASLRVREVSEGFEFAIEDLGSRNGTLVEGTHISAETPLGPGQVFELGRSFWMVRIATETAARRAQRTEPEQAATASPPLLSVARALRRLATSDLPVLLTGETGTGKEFLARILHEHSRRSGRFVRCNLSLLPRPHAEAALLGTSDQQSLFQQASAGTLFIEGLGELAPETQSTLLWALTRRPMPEPAANTTPSDVRLVGASVGDLESMVAAGKFRADLFSRIAGFSARVPPLRERREDLGLLTRSFVRTPDGKAARVTSDAFRRVVGHRWPFNVRELKQTLEAAVVVASDKTITGATIEECLDRGGEIPTSAARVETLRQALVRLLATHGGDTVAVARSLKRERGEVERWLHRFDIEPHPTH